jgi:acyl carrier protein
MKDLGCEAILFEALLKGIFIIASVMIVEAHADIHCTQWLKRGGYMSATKDVIINFIKENFVMGRSDTIIDPSMSLIESGIMDSTGVLELVEFLESTFSIKIEDEELVPENLETIDNIIAFLNKKGVA